MEKYIVTLSTIATKAKKLGHKGAGITLANKIYNLALNTLSVRPNNKFAQLSAISCADALILQIKTSKEIISNMDELVTFSYNSVTKNIDKSSATIGASAGDQLSVKDCLYSLLLPSANDVANALAEHIAGSMNDFVLLMNERASQLGLKNTNFTNPSGLHDDNQFSTANDLAIIYREAMRNKLFMQISSSVSYTHAPIRRYKNPNNSNNQVLNTNSIMVPGSNYYYKGATSGKTGHTKLAGYNLAMSAKKNNMHLITIILGAQTEKIRFNEAKKLLDFHFNNYKSLTIKNFDPRFFDDSHLSINDVNMVNTLNITCNENSHITLPKNISPDEVTSKISYQVTDIYNKYAIGNINYYLYDKNIGSCTIEGKDPENPDLLFISHLSITRANDSNNTIDTNNNIQNNENNVANLKVTSSLINIDSNGKISFSSTLMKIISITIGIIIIILIILFLYEKIFTNENFSINKIRFRIKRFFKH